MNETFQDTLRNGYLDWRKNLMLGAPHLLSNVLMAVMLISGLLAFGVTAGFVSSSGTSSLISFVVLVGFVSFWVISMLFVHSFFLAASFGMSRKVVEGGRVSAGDVMLFGRRHLRAMFSVVMLLFVAAVIPLVLFGGLVMVLFSSGHPNAGFALLLSAFALYMLIASFLYFLSLPSTAAAVLEERGGFAALNLGYLFLKKNKTRVFLFCAVSSGATSFIGMIYGTITGPLQWLSDLASIISPALSVLVLLIMVVLLILYLTFISLTLSPIYSMWLVRMYLSQTCGIKKTEYFGPVSPPETPEPSSQRPQLYV